MKCRHAGPFQKNIVIVQVGKKLAFVLIQVDELIMTAEFFSKLSRVVPWKSLVFRGSLEMSVKDVSTPVNLCTLVQLCEAALTEWPEGAAPHAGRPRGLGGPSRTLPGRPGPPWLGRVLRRYRLSDAKLKEAEPRLLWLQCQC